MGIIEKVINLFGLSPEDEAVSLLLASYEISERPEYEDNPIQSLSKNDEGFLLRFEGKLGYEKTYAPSLGSGTMVLSEVRVHGPLNKDGYSPYKGTLPCGLHFEQDIEEIKRLLGKPDLEDEPGTPRRVLIWNNVEGLQLGMVLTKDEKHMSYLDILPVLRK